MAAGAAQSGLPAQRFFLILESSFIHIPSVAGRGRSKSALELGIESEITT